jgi:signal transduction histidine kinase
LGSAFGVDPNLVRIAFVVLAFASGAGFVIYLVCWLVLPSQRAAGSPERSGPPRASGRPQIVEAAALAALVIGVLLLLRPLRVGYTDKLVWPVLLAGFGVALLWGRFRTPTSEPAGPRSTADGRETAWAAAMASLAGDTGGPSRATLARVALGAVLVVVGLGVFLGTHPTGTAARNMVTALLVFATGIGLVFGPWLWRLAADLSQERRVRVRAQERAELAAHVHDSVLHTLALVCRNADDPSRVVSLARRQERELRSWLAGRSSTAADSLGVALDETCGTVEADHGVQVEIVKVGDCALEPELEPLIGATREALVNAARHSGSSSIAVYVEVETTRVTTFVRDRGTGFTIDEVDADRRGVTDSIFGRMRSHGGTAEIRSDPGAGTEVELTMPRAPT